MEARLLAAWRGIAETLAVHEAYWCERDVPGKYGPLMEARLVLCPLPLPSTATDVERLVHLTHVARNEPGALQRLPALLAKPRRKDAASRALAARYAADLTALADSAKAIDTDAGSFTVTVEWHRRTSSGM